MQVEVGGWPEVMRKVVAQMREHVKSVSLSVQEAHVISGVDADSVLGSEEVRKTRTRPAEWRQDGGWLFRGARASAQEEMSVEEGIY